jgi:citrate synthase
MGVKQASLYSYVSRGVLTRRKSAAGRTSRFSAAEVDALARRGRPRRTGGTPELVIETALTEIAGDHLRYRGADATGLAAKRSLEEVAGLLWMGTLGDPGPPWRATPEAVAIGAAAQSALPSDTLPLERLQVIVPALAAADPLRLHLDRPAVIAAAKAVIAGMVDCLPAAADPVGDSIADRLAARLCRQPPGRAMAGALRAALVLLADHELAASTLAARVAASVRADPYAVVATGLGAVGGSLHGGASLGAEVMLRSAAAPSDAAKVVGDLLRRGERVPGFGHFVYESSDPRCVLLLDLVRRAAPRSRRLAVADAVVAEAARRALPVPNIEYALAALTTTADMIPGASEAVFAVARSVGWIAHAIEEYNRDVPIRPRGIYTGPAAAQVRG